MQSTICCQTVYVVPDLHMPLLGRPAIQALELVKRVGSVEDKTFDTQKAFQFSSEILASFKDLNTFR